MQRFRHVFVLAAVLAAPGLAMAAGGHEAPPADHAAAGGDETGKTGTPAGHDGVKVTQEGVVAPQSAVPAEASQPFGEDFDTLPPYRLLRSLQFVQDAVVRGDHSAMEMQRFLLGVIDERLRAADQSVFDDPRNVDAALVYAMSGGNPATLDYLAVRDRFGNFDNEITTVLRAYLNGQAARSKEEMREIVEIYRDTSIGPYLALVAANVTAGMNDPEALALFDWARLTAPGTLVEEAALRRSLFISAKEGMIEEALHYAQLYARRFIHSPYAGQYADLLVDLVLDNNEAIDDVALSSILRFMDVPRQREVYLRIARKAAITGLRPLAAFASGKAAELTAGDDKAKVPAALAGLYGGLADLPSENIADVITKLDAVPSTRLGPRDQVLRRAAQMIADQIVSLPDPNSLTQAFSSNMKDEDAQDPQARPRSLVRPVIGPDGKVTFQTTKDLTAIREQEESLRGFIDEKRQTLDRIDNLLKGIEPDSASEPQETGGS